MQAKNPAIVKPSPEEAQEILEAFWMHVSHGHAIKSMSMLEVNPWILQERVPGKLSAWQGMPFLQTAIHLLQPELVTYGISHGAPLEDKCPKGNTALQSLIKSVVDSSDIQVPEKNQLYPLIGKLMDAGARCDLLSPHTQQPLWLQAAHLPIEIFEKFIKAGSPCDFIDVYKASGVAILIGFGNMSDKATMLILNGADVNLCNPKSIASAPLSSALDNNDSAMVELLLQHGADIQLKDDFERSFLHVAENQSTVQWLVAKGLDMEAKDVLGNTPLLHVLHCMAEAIKEGETSTIKEHERVAQAMILAGTNVHAKGFATTSLSASEFIAEHQEKAPDLYNVLLALTAREVARQTIKDIARMAP